MAQAQLTYDRHEDIIYMSFPERMELETRAQIKAHFDFVVSFWRANAGGRKSYFVVDFTNIVINMKELDYYAKLSDKAQAECAITSVRYGGDPLQRTITRLAGMKIHRPSHVYETRAEALAVVRALKAGELEAKNARKP